MEHCTQRCAGIRHHRRLRNQQYLRFVRCGAMTPLISAAANELSL
jgi:hypothetical protein